MSMCIDLHPSYITDESGEKTSVILPIDAYQMLLAMLAEQSCGLPVSKNIPNATTLAAFEESKDEPISFDEFKKLCQ